MLSPGNIKINSHDFPKPKCLLGGNEDIQLTMKKLFLSEVRGLYREGNF